MNEIHPAVKKLITVCQCNNIEYGTIEAAIDAGAQSISEVAAKTTATTGQCGGSCTPKVFEMIESRWPELNPPPAEKEDAADAWWLRPATNDE